MGQATDLPPSYEQATASASTAVPTPPPEPRLPEVSPVPDARPYHSLHQNTRSSNVVTLAPHLSGDASSLHSLITRQTRQPPRPHLTVRGQHPEVRSHPNRKENDTVIVVDFDFTIDLTPYFLPDPDHEVDWHELRVVGDNDDPKGFRGRWGRWRPGRPAWARKGQPREDDLEEGEDVRLVAQQDDVSGPGLMGWCERFCSDSARVKSFKFDRRVVGFNASAVSSALTSHLRSLNYQGNIYISTSLTNRSVTIYSPHWVNQLRNTGWVYYICVLLPLWIIAWPIIAFLERRYEVVSSEWFFSRSEALQRKCVAGRDEAAMSEELAPVVVQAAWERRMDGKVLTEQEMRLLRQLEREGRERGGRIQVVQWDRISGWGRDQTMSV